MVVYVFIPFGKVVTASASTTWSDWKLGAAAGLGAFGEVTLDRSRVLSEGIVSMMYQKASSGTTPSAVQVVDFRLG